jgi:lipopolysaccharide transport system ATP-binding protein
MPDIAIRAEGLAKQYRVGTGPRHDTLRDQIMATLAAPFRRSTGAATRDTMWALTDVSFEIKTGQIVGIIGKNGAGKSTLLKILSRITEPTRGCAIVYGRVGSLLEVGTGFHNELTGRENIFLSGAIMGMTRAEIRRKFDEIVAFAEVHQFLDTPVKHYSSGMYVRLAYAVAAHLDPEILLIDEVLSVGDLAFQRKCLEHAQRLRDRNATVLFVSHSMLTVNAMCERVIYLADGRVRFDGPPEQVIKAYESDVRANHTANSIGQRRGRRPPSDAPLVVRGIDLLDEAGRPCQAFDHGERMRVRLSFETPTGVTDPNFVVAFVRSDGVACCNFSTALDGFLTGSVKRSAAIEVLTPPLALVADTYTVHVLVWDARFERRYVDPQIGPVFQVRHDVLTSHFGVFHQPAAWHWVGDQPTSGERQTDPGDEHS